MIKRNPSCECEMNVNVKSPLDKMSRGMIHNKHRRMDHRLSVPHSTQPLGLYADGRATAVS